MFQWFRDLDRILRGEATFRNALSSGRIELSARGLSAVILLLGAVYGVSMGLFSVVSGRGGGWPQMLASMVKVPALFLLTLVVTFPSLYVFNALVGSRLTLHSVLRLIVAAISVMLALLASFGTIVAFFSFTTESYPFVVVLNVIVFAVSGVLGLGFLLQTLHRLTLAQEEIEISEMRASARKRATEAEQRRVADALLDPTPATSPEHASDGGGVDALSDEQRGSAYTRPLDAAPVLPPPLPHRLAGALDPIPFQRPGRNVRNVFRIWILLFGLVGAQMSWVLRPFIGAGKEFVLFRPKGGNFFESVVDHLGHLFGAK